MPFSDVVNIQGVKFPDMRKATYPLLHMLSVFQKLSRRGYLVDQSRGWEQRQIAICQLGTATCRLLPKQRAYTLIQVLHQQQPDHNFLEFSAFFFWEYLNPNCFDGSTSISPKLSLHSLLDCSVPLFQQSTQLGCAWQSFGLHMLSRDCLSHHTFITSPDAWPKSWLSILPSYCFELTKTPLKNTQTVADRIFMQDHGAVIWSAIIKYSQRIYTCLRAD